jgi:cell pole-organizing protein PopZ
MSGNGKTVEDLVKEMLRPMLKDWLDRNLPPMVERYVEREIVRLTRR